MYTLIRRIKCELGWVRLSLPQRWSCMKTPTWISVWPVSRIPCLGQLRNANSGSFQIVTEHSPTKGRLRVQTASFVFCKLELGTAFVHLTEDIGLFLVVRMAVGAPLGGCGSEGRPALCI